MIELLQGKSPINQGMIWVADYADGTYLFEYDRDTKKENKFYDIDRKKLIKFGLIGHDYNCHYDVFGGIFNINGRRINVRLITETDVHLLTEQNLLYNDIIAFKNASAKIDLTAKILHGEDLSLIRQSTSNIDCFNVGYKQKIHSNGVNFYFQAIASFPYDSIPHIKLKITSDQDLHGKLIVMVDNSTGLDSIVNLKANIGGTINWEMAL